LAIRIFFSTAANVGAVDDRPSNASGAGWPAGWTVDHVAVTGSTNADLLADAAARPDRSVLFADHQTAGKGRLDRSWHAPPGANLLVSILFHDVPAQPSELTRRVALAAVAASGELTGVDVRLKWPNDLLVDERKLAGILAERAASGDVVVGLGLNVNWAPDGAAALGNELSPSDVLRAVLVAYDRLPADVGEQYRAALGTLGRRVRIELPNGVVEGTASDVEADGRLVVIDACAVTHRFSAGDVVHLRRV
jgi:BirA family transcriptional regulator, biotin operon repressor / biotin---[acetyl-CoA-carboxylase] ligase